MKLHWWIVIALVLGIVVGVTIQATTEAPSTIGAELSVDPDGRPGAVIAAIEDDGPIAKRRQKKSRKNSLPTVNVGDRIVAAVLDRGTDDEVRVDIAGPEDLTEFVSNRPFGTYFWAEIADQESPRLLDLALEKGSPRDTVLAPFRFIAQLFLQLLKMLIIPLVFTSIIAGVSGLGGSKDFGRIGGKTFGYYLTTSMLAAATGLILVNVFRPGVGATLGLPKPAAAPEESLWDVFLRMVPENIFEALSSNGSMLQVIFFAILFGFFVTQVSAEHTRAIRGIVEAAFEVMMKLAQFVLKTIPIGVFCLVVRVVGETGIEVFAPLGLYMATVLTGLLFHALVTLPVVLHFVAKVNPLRWAKVMRPALMTAFSTSSSSMTLPVTMEVVEKEGGVSNRTSSFVLPLGSTINMDGTAIYECVGVIFLAQYYSSAFPDAFTLTLADQVKVVLLAMLASIGAAGIPSAGIVMMFTILSALKLPVEGAALILAVDRPLDMLRTMVNIWSDSCGAAVIARSEGESFAGLGETSPVGELVNSNGLQSGDTGDQAVSNSTADPPDPSDPRDPSGNDSDDPERTGSASDSS